MKPGKPDIFGIVGLIFRGEIDFAAPIADDGSHCDRKPRPAPVRKKSRRFIEMHLGFGIHLCYQKEWIFVTVTKAYTTGF